MGNYISNTPSQIKDMFDVVGIKSFDELFSDIKLNLKPKSFNLPDGKSEFEVLSHLSGVGKTNVSGLIPFIGGGYYDHYIPAAVGSLTSRSEFYTAYTPYQPECSQGTLQAIYEYQSSICALTDMDLANASLYDGGTALYEAVKMAVRVTDKKKIVIDGGVSPIYKKILISYTFNLNYEFEEIPVSCLRCDRKKFFDAIDDNTAAVVLSNPNFFGSVDDYSDIVSKAHQKGALAILSVYPVALGMIKTPGEMDADIVSGEGQPLGLPLNFGGPYLGFFATKKEYARKIPGRIVGETTDKNGKRCFVNTLQAREQHIRREKATSNICTNVALCAIQSGIFMSLLGKEGMKSLAVNNFAMSEFAKKEIGKISGVKIEMSVPTFNEFTVCLPKSADSVIESMLSKGFAAGFPLGRYYKGMDNCITVAVTEKRSKQEILNYVSALKDSL